jgi:hypothetical protein
LADQGKEEKMSAQLATHNIGAQALVGDLLISYQQFVENVSSIAERYNDPDEPEQFGILTIDLTGHLENAQRMLDLNRKTEALQALNMWLSMFNAECPCGVVSEYPCTMDLDEANKQARELFRLHGHIISQC